MIKEGEEGEFSVEFRKYSSGFEQDYYMEIYEYFDQRKEGSVKEEEQKQKAENKN